MLDRRRVALIALFALAGCGGSSHEAWTVAEPAPVRKAEVATELADLPAAEAPEELAGPRTPELDPDALLSRRWPPYRHLPAASDGRVALPIASADGTRNHPNLTIRIVDVETLTPASEIAVLAPDEWESESPGGARAGGAGGPRATDELRARVTERTARAGRALQEGGFAAMTLAYEADRPGAGPASANAAGVIIDWDPSARTLRAIDEAEGTERLRRVVDPPASECPQTPEPHLLAAWIDTEQNVLVARVGHERIEDCAHPDDRWLVLPLSPLPQEASAED